MTSEKQIELTIRASQLIKSVAELVGEKNVPVCWIVLAEVKLQLRNIEAFLETAEVEK